MKRIAILSLILIQIIVLHAQDYTLRVQDGTASGDFFYGDTVHIFSDNAPGLGVFAGWSGNGEQYLDIADEWYTTMVVPQQSGVTALNLQANYDVLPNSARIQMEDILLFGEEAGVFTENVPKNVHYAIPDNPKGMVFLFHGTGGSGANMFERYEILSLIKDFYHAGYGSISTDANERTLGDQNDDGKIRWIAGNAIRQSLNNNIDLFNIQALKDTFALRYNLDEDFPFFSYGVSNGANFSDLAAAVLGFKASAHNTGNGSPSLYALRTDATPVIWLQSINDQNSNADPAVSRSNYQALIDRDICTEWHWLQKSPIYEKRFMRSFNDINAPTSAAIYARLFDYPNLVDSDGIIQVENIIASFPNDFNDPLGLTNAQLSDVQSQLKVANADHTGHGNFNKTILRFFEMTCETTEAQEVYKPHYTLFPNPASDYLKIVHTSDEPMEIVIFDINGQQLLLENCLENPCTIDLSFLRSGYYFAKIKQGKEFYNDKFIILNRK